MLINGPETTSSKGIEVKGTINVTGKDVKIVVNDSGKNEEYGIYSLGSNNLTINSDSLLIDVDSVGGLATRGANGLYVNNAGTINLRSNQDIKFDVTAKDVIGYGIRTYGSGNYTTLDARGNIDFTVSVENTLFNRDVKSSGITNDGNHIYLSSDDNLSITSKGKNVNGVYGIWHNAQSASSKYQSTVTHLFSDKTLNIFASTIVDSSVKSSTSVAAVYLQGKDPTGTDKDPSELKLLGNSVYLTSALENNSQQTAVSYGIYATTAPFIAETYESPAIEDFSVETIKVTASASGNKSYAYGIYSYNSKTEPQTIDVSIINKNGSSSISGSGTNGASGYGVFMDNLSTQSENKISLTSLGNNTITGTSGAISMGDKGVTLNVTAQQGTNTVFSEKAQALYITDEASAVFSSGLDNYFSGTTAINSNHSNVSLTALRDNYVQGLESNAIIVSNNSILTLNATKLNYIKGDISGLQLSSSYSSLNAINNSVIGVNGSGINLNSSTIDILAIDSNSLSGKTYGIFLSGSGADITAGVNNIILGDSYATTLNSSNLKLESTSGVNDIVGMYSVYAYNSSDLDIISKLSSNYVGTVDKTSYGILSYDSDVYLLADDNNIIQAKTYGIYSTTYFPQNYSFNNVKLEAHNNIITTSSGKGIFVSSQNGLYSSDKGTIVDLLADDSNFINAGEIFSVEEHSFADNYAIYALSGSSVTLDAGNQNSLLGAVYAEGANTSVSLTGKSNTVSSYATIDNAGDLNTDDAFKDKSVISALYAEQGANISLSGASNILRTYAEYENDNQLERVVWAYNGKEGEKKGSSISIDGYSYISTDSYEKSPNSLDVAIAAGTATQLNFDKVNQKVEDDDRATVTVTYADIKDEEGKLHHSFISGDILAAYEGLIDITPKDDSAGITINGNLLAGNNGIVNVDLGQGGILTGRADDYGDAGVLVGTTHGNGVEGEGFFNPAFSSTIFKGGEVNLTMGEDSRWNVTGQSWITRINTKNSSNAIIDLVSANTDRNKTAHALTVYELTGNAEFHMSLDADRDFSDMLYIKNADGEYTVNVIDAVSHDDMYADGLDGLRFATVGAGSKAKFSAATFQSGGVKDIVYQVGTDAYAGNDENSVYNGDNMSEHKPGNSTVDGFFENNGKPGEAIPTPATQTLSL
uniref:hypothetical protein n=1 Tax=Succinatimonas hippei TaxID=626938 RepID=UPI0026EB37A8